ncbi:MAG: GHKL domain-containing protein, partial [Lachnospiraceae bacterium]|nr:GHKL domain-containing protein [Lachnospiraceae bacterium]MDY4165714.1 GHKL domain-containing protein [Lachnospiraceae bacterium]
YNTGNLVIDSMLTNYENIARQSGVDFSTDLHINNKRVPVRDYDLSIILGNILDNAIKATSDSKGMYIYIEMVTGKDNRFQIICENSVSQNVATYKIQPHKEIEHGYGLSNIRTTVEKYYGFMSCVKDNPWIISIEIPIISDEQFIAPPHWRQKSTNSHD